MDLLRVIEMYQDKIIVLSIEEGEMGRFLKSQSTYDNKTRAGKMMAAVGKAQNFASQQRTALRLPLVRLYNEVETFRFRAVADTWLTVRRMENARTEYRGALLWMRNVSQELDPDTSKKLEKFRRVQAQVKKTKTKFDRLKTDVIQKIDLLSASRCNMFSHVLVQYQQTLIQFWEKTARTMNAVADAFKGYQYYEFNIIKVRGPKLSAICCFMVSASISQFFKRISSSRASAWPSWRRRATTTSPLTANPSAKRTAKKKRARKL